MRIYVGNLDYAINSDGLRALFEKYGEVASAEVQVKGRTGQSRGFGLVEMPNAHEAEAAIAALNGSEHRGRALTVNEARPRRTIRDSSSSYSAQGSGNVALGEGSTATPKRPAETNRPGAPLGSGPFGPEKGLALPSGQSSGAINRGGRPKVQGDVAVYFDAEFSGEEVELFLNYLTETQREMGGSELRFVPSDAAGPEGDL